MSPILADGRRQNFTSEMKTRVGLSTLRKNLLVIVDKMSTFLTFCSLMHRTWKMYSLFHRYYRENLSSHFNKTENDSTNKTTIVETIQIECSAWEFPNRNTFDKQQAEFRKNIKMPYNLAVNNLRMSVVQYMTIFHNFETLRKRKLRKLNNLVFHHFDPSGNSIRVWLNCCFSFRHMSLSKLLNGMVNKSHQIYRQTYCIFIKSIEV